MNEAQEINKLRNAVGALTHELGVARTELQLLRQLNQKLLTEKAELEKIAHEKIAHPLITEYPGMVCPRCAGRSADGRVL